MTERARRCVAALLLCHSLSGCSAPEGGSAPPNVILISLDTLNRNALRAYDPNAAPLPALDAFAESARRFRNAYSTASWTLPAHASLMTGLYPDRHGATARPQRLAPETVTLAELLQRAGYQTAAFTEGGYLHEHFGLAKGGELRSAPASIAVIRPDWWYIRSDGREELYAMSADPEQRSNQIDSSAAAAEIARDSAAERARYAVGPQPRDADEEVTRQLRALGYIE